MLRIIKSNFPSDPSELAIVQFWQFFIKSDALVLRRL